MIKQYPRVAATERNEINRRMLVFINRYPDKPVKTINYESLAADVSGMALSTIQGPYIRRRFILGGYEAEYQFKVIYRVKPGNSNDKRLAADETLDALGDWMITQRPDIGDGLAVSRIEISAPSSLFGAYENGDEDHQILMKMTYYKEERV